MTHVTGMGRRRSLTVAAVGGLVCLSGCTTQPAPRTASLPVATRSATTSPPAAPSTTPSISAAGPPIVPCRLDDALMRVMVHDSGIALLLTVASGPPVIVPAGTTVPTISYGVTVRQVVIGHPIVRSGGTRVFTEGPLLHPDATYVAFVTKDNPGPRTFLELGGFEGAVEFVHGRSEGRCAGYGRAGGNPVARGSFVGLTPASFVTRLQKLSMADSRRTASRR